VELRAEVTGNVWKVVVSEGQEVGAGDTVLIMESMKMEIPLTAPVAGVVEELRVQEGGQAAEGDVLAVLRT